MIVEPWIIAVGIGVVFCVGYVIGLMTGAAQHWRETVDISQGYQRYIGRLLKPGMVAVPRKPTEAMRYAAFAVEAFAPECHVSSIQFDPTPVWNRMIDEAIKASDE